jgi:chloramphenicol-sensitive protein RarD
MTDATRGVCAIAAAAAIWGLSGMYYKALAHVPALEVLSHRTLWSVVLFAGVLVLQRRTGEFRRVASDRATLAVLALAAAMIGANWLLFIVSVQTGRALEASLGYYIFPLCAVALGGWVFGERFTRGQILAIVAAAVAVALLAYGLRAPPWIALILACTFAVYGLLKKRVAVGPVLSVSVETSLLALPALVWVLGAHAGGWNGPGLQEGAWFGRDAATTLLLVGAGPLTAVPLILMSYAARRIGYATLGLVQYLNPTLQFLVAVMVFAEPFTRWHEVAFPLIWLGLALYSWESWRSDAAGRRRSMSAGMPSSSSR